MEWGIPPSLQLLPQAVFPSFPFLLLPKFLKEATSLPPSHYHPHTLHSFWNQPATPTIQMKSLSLKHHTDLLLPNRYGLFSAFLLPGPFGSIRPCRPSPSPTLSGLSAPQFQPQHIPVLDSTRPGYGHRPKLSLLICKRGLIKPTV